ncbi:uncharacterized protein LOC114362857 [Ostrinia furnacalis]|uniref:uncharacterized protein LOC114362857 n=1 Tax=Ostrinia furnacalis TaxID=93504 RepID=UPI00103D079B|nr:uncharacterized protein LOC114362857 [Ostrinia furnacalis]
MGAPYAELEKPLEEYAVLCRGCLAESGVMKDMVEWGLTEDFFKFTNVQVDQSNGLSQLLCTTCEDLLDKCKSFREQCRNSNNVLIDIMKKKTKESSISPEPIVELVENKTDETEEQESDPISISCILCEDQLIIMITAADTESKIYFSCPYSCTDKFLKKPDLLHHLSKYHNVDEKSFEIEFRYYCAFKDCNYHASNTKENKWFSGRKFLNQHYNKVHKNKRLHCDVCSLRFTTDSEFNRHLSTCNMKYSCPVCPMDYDLNEKLLVHLMRRHPEIHKQYKNDRKAYKRKAKIETETKKAKVETERLENYMCDSPKRSFATQTLKPEENIKNDVSLWNIPGKSDEAKTDEISTQTVFEDLLSLKSQNSEDESIFFSETVSLSDIQTQTFPLEFGLSRSNKETITSETQSPDLSIKETQTCVCLYDSPKTNYRLFDSVSSSPCSINLTSTETQTAEFRSSLRADVLLSFNSTETQTCFDEDLDKSAL